MKVNKQNLTIMLSFVVGLSYGAIMAVYFNFNPFVNFCVAVMAGLVFPVLEAKEK